MPSQMTVTLKTGPDRAVTAQVLTNVTNVNIDTAKRVLTVTADQGIKEFDMGNIATFTDTISGANHTIVASS